MLFREISESRQNVKGDSYQSLFRDGIPARTWLCTGVMKSNFMSFKACKSIGSNLPSITL